MSLAADIVAAIRADPVALKELRELVGEASRSRPLGSAPAYTVRSLATELGRSERSVRGAIARGELEAVKRGRGYLISADAVERWATSYGSSSPGRRARREAAPTRRNGVMRRALRP